MVVSSPSSTFVIDISSYFLRSLRRHLLQSQNLSNSPEIPETIPETPNLNHENSKSTIKRPSTRAESPGEEPEKREYQKGISLPINPSVGSNSPQKSSLILDEFPQQQQNFAGRTSNNASNGQLPSDFFAQKASPQKDEIQPSEFYNTRIKEKVISRDDSFLQRLQEYRAIYTKFTPNRRNDSQSDLFRNIQSRENEPEISNKQAGTLTPAPPSANMKNRKQPIPRLPGIGYNKPPASQQKKTLPNITKTVATEERELYNENYNPTRRMKRKPEIPKQQTSNKSFSHSKRDSRETIHHQSYFQNLLNKDRNYSLSKSPPPSDIVSSNTSLLQPSLQRKRPQLKPLEPKESKATLLLNMPPLRKPDPRELREQYTRSNLKLKERPKKKLDTHGIFTIADIREKSTRNPSQPTSYYSGLVR